MDVHFLSRECFMGILRDFGISLGGMKGAVRGVIEVM